MSTMILRIASMTNLSGNRWWLWRCRGDTGGAGVAGPRPMFFYGTGYKNLSASRTR